MHEALTRSRCDARSKALSPTCASDAHISFETRSCGANFYHTRKTKVSSGLRCARSSFRTCFVGLLGFTHTSPRLRVPRGLVFACRGDYLLFAILCGKRGHRASLGGLRVREDCFTVVFWVSTLCYVLVLVATRPTTPSIVSCVVSTALRYLRLCASCHLHSCG